MHPDGTAHGGSAIIIKNNIKHYETVQYCTEEIQATSVRIEDWVGSFVISAVYSPPKHKLKVADYVRFLATLGHRFIAGGVYAGYNAKHHYWGSRTVTTNGRQLKMTIDKLNLNVVSPGQPTYLPTDRRTIPDVIDFFITKGFPSSFITSRTTDCERGLPHVVDIQSNALPAYVFPDTHNLSTFRQDQISRTSRKSMKKCPRRPRFVCMYAEEIDKLKRELHAAQENNGKL